MVNALITPVDRGRRSAAVAALGRRRASSTTCARGIAHRRAPRLGGVPRRRCATGRSPCSTSSMPTSARQHRLPDGRACAGARARDAYGFRDADNPADAVAGLYPVRRICRSSYNPARGYRRQRQPADRRAGLSESRSTAPIRRAIAACASTRRSPAAAGWTARQMITLQNDVKELPRRTHVPAHPAPSGRQRGRPTWRRWSLRCRAGTIDYDAGQHRADGVRDVHGLWTRPCWRCICRHGCWI